MIAIAADGHKLLDPHFDPYSTIAAKQCLFAEWRDQWATREVKALDGNTSYAVNKLTLSEARSPAGKGNAQATEMVVQLAEQMANAALTAMRDPRRAIADKLSSQVWPCPQPTAHRLPLHSSSPFP